MYYLNANHIDRDIKQVNSMKLLGTNFDPKLTWRQHKN